MDNTAKMVEEGETGALLMMALQICDTSFPSGSLANSSGLESALAHGLVSKSDGVNNQQQQQLAGSESSDSSLLCFFQLSLEQASAQALPLVQASHLICSFVPSSSSHLHAEQVDGLCDVDSICNAVTLNEVTRRASLNQGKCFLRAASIAFADRPRAASLVEISNLIQRDSPPCLHGHYATIFGATCAILGIPLNLAERVFLRCLLRDLVSCAARLNAIGPLQGAYIQAKLGQTTVEALLKDQLERRQCDLFHKASTKGDDPAAVRRDVKEWLLGEGMPRQTSPILDLVQGRHDLLYARLFNS